MAIDVDARGTMSAEEIVALSKKHTMFEWSAQNAVDPIPMATAKGSYFFTTDGKRYLDFNSQLMSVNIGHGDQRVIDAIAAQAQTLAYANPFMAHEPRARLGAKLAQITPGDLDVVFFTNGGAEANENAMKLARFSTGRHKILAAYRSYHGATHGAITLTGDPRRWASEPAVSGVVHFCGPYAYRSSFHSTSEQEEAERALAHLEEIVMYEGPQTVAGIILETIVGTNGILVPPDGYLQGVRELCDRHGIVMMMDEVMTGFGRTGKWFGVEHWGVEPDLISCAKGITSGYVPLGAVLISGKIAAAFQERTFFGGLTYSGHPLACAAGLAAIETTRDEGVVENAQMIGEEVIAPALADLMANHKSVGNVRGKGCFWGIELVKNLETREMLAPFNASAAQMGAVGELSKAAMQRGLSLMTHWNVVMVAPPLIITPDEARRGLSILDDVLKIADAAAD